MKLALSVLPGSYAICRLEAGDALPAWVHGAAFYSVTRTAEELSVVCPASIVPPGTRCEPAWRCVKVVGPLDFALTGVLAALATPLAAAGVSVFAVSTFDTDYLLVRELQLDWALRTLRQAGHAVA